MQKRRNVVIIASLTLSAGLMAAVAPRTVSAHGKKTHAQNLTVTVDGNGYHPATLNAKAGKPVHLTFISKGAGCANDIHISSLKKSINLKPGHQKEIVFTPKKGQTVAFACSMNMFRGKVTGR